MPAACSNSTDCHRRFARGIDELGDGVDLELVGIDHENGQESRRQRDRRKILLRIVGELLVKRRIGRKGRDVAQQDGVAVGRRLGDELGADICRRARLVLDHDRLADDVRHFGADQACEEVGSSAGRVRDHQMDGLRRIGLRAGNAAR
jgi:hypothetical protein